MIVLRARNVHQALPLGVQLLQTGGVARSSRGGPVVECPEPVTTVYERPTERVLFWPQRDANPFFHLFESLWMLAGRRDVSTLYQYNKRMAQYSDDGEKFHGAYGHRWRTAFGVDQLQAAVTLLKADPDSRRAVLQMWHAPFDLGKNLKDLPCNTQAYFKLRDGALRITVTQRSGDMCWGIHGANAVHFSQLQEYLAGKLGVAVGPYTQVSDSYHAYKGVWEKVQGLPVGEPCPYTKGEVAPHPLGSGDYGWDEDLVKFFHSPNTPFQTPYFSRVVQPLYWAYWAYQTGSMVRAYRRLNNCAATDWTKAAAEWFQRRRPMKAAAS